MNAKNGLKRIFRFYRVAPLGETVTILSSCLLSLILFSPLAFYSTIGVLLGLGLTVEQYANKNKMEKSIKEYGYDQKYFIKTIPKWCSRQTAKTVTEKYGCYEQYKELIKKAKQYEGSTLEGIIMPRIEHRRLPLL